MSRGIGQYHNTIRERKKKSILKFIERNQPVTYNQIREKGGFRTNTLKEYVNSLIEEKKIVELEKYYLINPPGDDILKNMMNKRELEDYLKLSISNSKKLKDFDLNLLAKFKNPEFKKKYPGLEKFVIEQLGVDKLKKIIQEQKLMKKNIELARKDLNDNPPDSKKILQLCKKIEINNKERVNTMRKICELIWTYKHRKPGDYNKNNIIDRHVKLLEMLGKKGYGEEFNSEIWLKEQIIREELGLPVEFPKSEY